QVAGGAVPVAILLIANWRTTGQPLLFGYEALNGPAHLPGFHQDPTGSDFPPLKGLYLMSAYLLRLNAALFASPIPAVPLIVAALALMRRASTWDDLLIAFLGVILLGYGFYWWEGYYAKGPRFLYTALPALLIIVAKLPSAISVRLHQPVLQRAAMLLLPVCVVGAWIIPPGVPGPEGVWTAARNAAPREATVRADIGAQLAAADLDNALVFVREPWHARLAARLRALGVPPLLAERVVPAVDACALQAALDAADSAAQTGMAIAPMQVLSRAVAAGEPAPVPGLTGDQSISLVGRRPSTAACASELAADEAGTTELAPFLPYDGLDADGRLGGRVVFARDYGARDELLRARFGSRTWYRYRPSRGPDDANPVFVPYVPGTERL
ncbi:MAG TPA: hypothetical protein VMH39_01360, partial [Gemmatimonadaceae bacterium]|nr:hypothetical protein [Gemmatimonadaceae bacterium]